MKPTLRLITSLMPLAMTVLLLPGVTFGQSDSFEPTNTSVDWTKVDRGAISQRLEKIKAEIAAKRKVADQQAKAAKELRKRHNDNLPPAPDIYNTPGEDPAVMIARQKELSKLRTEAYALEQSTKGIQDEITDLTWEEVRLGRDLRKAEDESVRAFIKREEAAKKEAERVQRETERARKEAEKQAAAREKQFQDAIETMAVTQSFQSLQAIVNDTNHTLDELERKYDQALIGAYMKDKMTALLNSKAFCAAKANCDASAKDKKPIGPEMSEIFPWSDPKLDRSQPRAAKTSR